MGSPSCCLRASRSVIQAGVTLCSEISFAAAAGVMGPGHLACTGFVGCAARRDLRFVARAELRGGPSSAPESGMRQLLWLLCPLHVTELLSPVLVLVGDSKNIFAVGFPEVNNKELLRF